jgi:restriction system protein
MTQTADDVVLKTGLGWKTMLFLAVLFPVAGFIVIPAVLGASSGTGPAITLAQGAGLGAAIVFGASAIAMLVRGHGQGAHEFDGLASMTEMGLSEAPPTVHSAPTQFDPDDSLPLETEMMDMPVPHMVAQAARPAITWTLDVLQSLEWCHFEKLCAGYYREKGIRNVSISLAANGGMDIYLFQDDTRPKRATAVIHARSRGVVDMGVQGIRELLGVMAHERIERAFFMTNGVFTPEAKALGHHHKIVLVDGRVLLAMIQRLDEDQQARLLAEATAGDYRTPTCPMCGQKMQRATGSHGDYWGCARHPHCAWIMPVLAS